jgi:hypothetical protein
MVNTPTGPFDFLTEANRPYSSIFRSCICGCWVRLLDPCWSGTLPQALLSNSRRITEGTEEKEVFRTTLPVPRGRWHKGLQTFTASSIIDGYPLPEATNE